MKWLLGVFTGLFFMVLATPVYAIDFMLTGTEITASYVEPNTNTDGSTLKDLAKTTIYYDIVGDGKAAFKGGEVSATAPTGNGNITQKVLIPILTGQESDVEFWATASDITGNESAPSNKVMKRIDRLTPSSPK